MYGLLAEDTFTSSGGWWGLLGTAVAAIGGVVITLIQRSRNSTEETKEENSGRVAAAKVAAESTVETALESWDRIIGQPQRDEILELRKLLDRRGKDLSDAMAQLNVIKDQNNNLVSQLGQANHEINRLLKALVKRSDDGG